jgi:hypothetical protein
MVVVGGGDDATGAIESIKNSILLDIKKNWDSLCRAITRPPNKSRADRHSYYAVLLTSWIKPSYDYFG